MVANRAALAVVFALSLAAIAQTQGVGTALISSSGSSRVVSVSVMRPR